MLFLHTNVMLTILHFTHSNLTISVFKEKIINIRLDSASIYVRFLRM